MDNTSDWVGKTLRYAIDEAKAANIPKDTIEKAIKKGSGELGESESYDEVRYEGYGAGGVAVIVDVLTDKVTRTAPEMRKIFEKHGGNLGKPGAVAFGFAAKGVIVLEASKANEDQADTQIALVGEESPCKAKLRDKT